MSKRPQPSSSSTGDPPESSSSQAKRLKQLRHDPVKGPPKLTLSEMRKTILTSKKQFEEEVDLGPYSSLSERTKSSYAERKQRYLEFLTMVNEDRALQNPPLPQLKPFTRESFNQETLEEYLHYRALTSRGRVPGEDFKPQLGTMSRELSHIFAIGKREGEKIELGEEVSRYLHNVLYKLSEIGVLGRKGKDQAIFGVQELTIIVEMIMREAPSSGNINYEYQTIIYLLIILYSGARPSSLSKLNRVKDAPYMKWEHVEVFKHGRDDRGFKITVVITLPHLKGRGKYFTEAQRTFRKTFTSSYQEGAEYNVNLDVCLFIVALAFRRRITVTEDFGDWYRSRQALLPFKEEAKQLPVFVNYGFNEANEPDQPLRSDSAEHVTSRKIQAAGLNIQGTLYSFRRNFAQTINDNLSRTTAATLMGHTPESLTLKKSYAGRFERLDMTRLMTTGESAQGATVNPLLDPALYRLKDVTIYYPTDQELDELYGEDPGIAVISEERDLLKDDLTKKYGNKKQSSWVAEDLQKLKRLNEQYKRRRRMLKMRLTREKLLRVIKAVPSHLMLDENGQMVLDEDTITEVPKRIPHKSAVEEAEEAAEPEVTKLRKKRVIQIDSDEEESEEGSEEESEEDFEEEQSEDEDSEEEWEYTTATPGDAEDQEEAEEDKEEEELDYEEGQAADYVISSQEGSQDVPKEDDQTTEGENPTLTDACYIDIQRLITLQHRPTGKSYCQWCVAEGLEPTRQYEGYMNIVTHLYDSQGPRGWHSSYERWLREIISELQPTTAGKFKCPIRSCSASRDKIAPLKDHLKTKHASSYVTNLTEEEKWNQVREYFREHHSYELTQSDIDRVYREKENRKARLQKKKMEKSSTPATASPSTSTSPSPSTSTSPSPSTSTSQRTPKPSSSSSRPSASSSRASASSSKPSSTTARKGKGRSAESPTTRSKKTTKK